MAAVAAFTKLVRLYEQHFAKELKKEMVIREQGEPIFNPGAYRNDEGKYFVYGRYSARHWTYPGWIRLYCSHDGSNFEKKSEHFLTAPYAISEHSFGCEDDRCTELSHWFAHTYTLLLPQCNREPNRKEYLDHVALALGKSPDDATFCGLVDIPKNKNAALIETKEHIYLLHRPMAWDTPASVYCGTFDKGFTEAVERFSQKDDGALETFPRLTPPSGNRCLLAPMPDWSAYKIGLGAQPLQIGDEWLFTYHVRTDPYVYWWSAGLLAIDENGPYLRKVLNFPLCMPDTPWEIVGDVPRVTFLCGVTRRDKVLEFWTGAADCTIMRVDINLDYLLSTIEKLGVGFKEVQNAIKSHVQRNEAVLRDHPLICQDWLSRVQP